MHIEFNGAPLASTVTASPGTLSSSALFPQFSRSSTPGTLGDLGFSEGAADKDMFALIVNETWDEVADYRPIITVTIEEEVDWWWDWSCWGAPNHALNLEIATSLGAVSYRYEAEPTWVCWAVAAIGHE